VVTEDIRPLRLSTTNIIARKWRTRRIRIYDWNGGYKAYYEQDKVEVRFYTRWYRWRYGRIRIRWKKVAIWNNYITIKDSKNQTKQIRYEILPYPKTYRIRLQEKENGYINIPYAWYYSFRVYGGDKIRLYKQANRVRIYGEKAWRATIYIYYKRWYIWRIEVKVEAPHKVITIRNRIYEWRGIWISLKDWWRYDVLKYDRNKIYVYKRRWSSRMRVYGREEWKAEVWLRSRYENVDYRIILEIVKPKPLEVKPEPDSIREWETKTYQVSYERRVRLWIPWYYRRYIEWRIEGDELISGEYGYCCMMDCGDGSGIRWRWRRIYIRRYLDIWQSYLI
jgi:hypothetical protein